MIFDLNPLRVLRLFAPLWILLALSVWLHGEAWLKLPVLFAAIALLPIGAAVLAATVLRQRWRLEVTRDGLIHRTLRGPILYEWKRMGPIKLTRGGPAGFVPVLVFAYETEQGGLSGKIGQAMGRSILCVFGDGKPVELAAAIERQRLAFSA
jgi:hypothetical protein